MGFQFSDGGRSAAGFTGNGGDCVARAIAIATEQSYRSVFEALSLLGWFPGNGIKRDLDGLYRSRPDNESHLIREYLAARGWIWVPCMSMGSGCKVHLRKDDLPPGRLIVRVSRHLAAVIDGVIHDTRDCSRDGTRCVYGYWQRPVDDYALESIILKLIDDVPPDWLEGRSRHELSAWLSACATTDRACRILGLVEGPTKEKENPK